jgi:hypothetical protein
MCMPVYVCVCVCVCVFVFASAGAVGNKNNLLTFKKTFEEGKKQQYVHFMHFHIFYSKYFTFR